MPCGKTGQMMRCDRRPLNHFSGDILCFATARNEALRLPYFLEYHRTLGVDRFFVVDNHSGDGSLELLLAQPDVHVFSAVGSYAASNYGMDWMNALLAEHAMGHWVLALDVDELLVYPDCETVGLHDLVRYLDANGAEALKAFLLDMYAEGPIRHAIYRSGTPFVETCPWFDADTYVETGKDGIPVRGGPRHRLFFADQHSGARAPVLHKVPLAKWRQGLHFTASTHALGGARFAEITGVLQHFKFFSDFIGRAAEEAVRGEHWQQARQYRSYDRRLTDQPGLSAWFEGSRRYGSSEDLVRMGLMRRPGAYARFISELPQR